MSEMSDSQAEISPVASTGTTYYVDALAGDDSSHGMATPWRSFNRVNPQAITPGDTLLLDAGSRWQGQYYVQYYRLKGAR